MLKVSGTRWDILKRYSYAICTWFQFKSKNSNAVAYEPFVRNTFELQLPWFLTEQILICLLSGPFNVICNISYLIFDSSFYNQVKTNNWVLYPPPPPKKKKKHIHTAYKIFLVLLQIRMNVLISAKRRWACSIVFTPCFVDFYRNGCHSCYSIRISQVDILQIILQISSDKRCQQIVSFSEMNYYDHCSSCVLRIWARSLDIIVNSWQHAGQAKFDENFKWRAWFCLFTMFC